MRGSCLVKKITESAKEIVYILCFIVIITDCLLHQQPGVDKSNPDSSRGM